MAKLITGVVSSISGNKTIAVKVERRRTHPILRKQYLDSKKFMVHDEKNEALVGDKVSIVETRPISATKHFKLESILVRPKLRDDSLSVLKADAEIPTSEKEVVTEKPKKAPTKGKK